MALAPEKIRMPVTREIEDDAVQPTGERGIAAKKCQAAICADESILRDFLGVGMIAEMAESDREHSRFMACDNFSKRFFVSGFEAAYQLSVIHRGRISDGGVVGFSCCGKSRRECIGKGSGRDHGRTANGDEARPGSVVLLLDYPEHPW